MIVRFPIAVALASMFASAACAQAPQRPPQAPQATPDAQPQRPRDEGPRPGPPDGGQRRKASQQTYRGSFVCEKMPSAPDILNVPLDLTIRDGAAIFARPIVGWNGRPVFGTEIGIGGVDDSGALRLVSNTTINGASYLGEYAGRLTDAGGTFAGTQTWAGRNSSGSRTCVAAFVLSPAGESQGGGQNQ